MADESHYNDYDEADDKLRTELSKAISDVMSKHGFMVTNWEMTVEVLAVDDSETYLWCLSPHGQNNWVTLGMLEFHKMSLARSIQ